METIDQNNITIDEIQIHNSISTSVLRLDKIHQQVSGNKWYKLKYHLKNAKQLQKDTILTFGGAYSNHIIATAVVCKMFGFKAIGIIRGEQPAQLAHTLKDAQDYGMELHFMSRTDYRNKLIPSNIGLQNVYIIAEGGYGMLGTKGFKDITIDKAKYDFTLCAVGTGTMMAGLINAGFKNVIGISVMKNNFQLNENVAELTGLEVKKINILHNYHRGGYAKYNQAQLDFMNSFYQIHNIPTDFVYSAKLMMAVEDLIKINYFLPNSKILIIHCGGLQGNLSLNKDALIF